MRILYLFIVLLCIDWYAYQAIRLTIQPFSGLSKNIVNVLYWSVPVLTMGLFVLYQNNALGYLPKSLLTLLRAFLFVIYLSKLFIILPLFIDDVRRLIGKGTTALGVTESYNAGRSQFFTRMAILLGLLPLTTLSYGIIRNPYRYKVRREKIKIPNLPAALEGLKMVQVSDIHAGSFFYKEPLFNAVEIIQKLQPDLLFFTGDLVNSKAEEMNDYMDVFSQFKATYGVFSVLGNHDYGDYVQWNSAAEKTANFQDLLAKHQQLGWQLLLNEHRVLDIGQEKVAIIGVENYSALPQFHKYGNLAQATANLPSAAVNILLSHDPSHWDYEVTPKHKDIHLTLSGHTHGFQFGIEIPGWLRWSPSQYMYRQWAGLYQAGQQYLYVNRGFGFLGYPGRVGILPEITLLELTAA